MLQKMIIGTVALVMVAFLVYGLNTNSSPSFLASSPVLAEAMAEANADGKFILVDFHATWCPPCKQFSGHVKEDADIRSTLEDVVLLKVDCENGEGIELARKLKIKSLPTFIVMSTSGHIESRWSGYAKGHFLEHLEKVIYE